MVLTEDGGADAEPTIRALVIAACKLLRDGVQTHRLCFQTSGDGLRSVLNGNRWKSGKSAEEGKIRLLIRAVADHLLLEDPPGFVFFHVDGDQPWSLREDSENLAKFDAILRVRIARRIAEVRPAWTEDEIERRMARLVGVHPFWSVEAWLYQNLDELAVIAGELTGARARQLREQLASWVGDPTQIEELRKPKDICALGDTANLRLANRGWPAARIAERGQSFATLVDTMARCEALLEALTPR